MHIIARVRLALGFEISAYIPGIGRNSQENYAVLHKGEPSFVYKEMDEVEITLNACGIILMFGTEPLLYSGVGKKRMKTLLKNSIWNA